jgi:hypothetical protein
MTEQIRCDSYINVERIQRPQRHANSITSSLNIFWRCETYPLLQTALFAERCAWSEDYCLCAKSSSHGFVRLRSPTLGWQEMQDNEDRCGSAQCDQEAWCLARTRSEFAHPVLP